MDIPLLGLTITRTKTIGPLLHDAAISSGATVKASPSSARTSAEPSQASPATSNPR